MGSLSRNGRAGRKGKRKMKIIDEKLLYQLREVMKKATITQFNEIIQGVKSGVDVLMYADTKYNWQQMFQIRVGLEYGLNAAMYADEKYNWEQMQEIRLGLEQGADVSEYSRPTNDWKTMYRARCELVKRRGA